MLELTFKKILERKEDPLNVFKIGLSLKCSVDKLDYMEMTSQYPLRFTIVARNKNIIKEWLIKHKIPSEKIKLKS